MMNEKDTAILTLKEITQKYSCAIVSMSSSLSNRIYTNYIPRLNEVLCSIHGNFPRVFYKIDRVVIYNNKISFNFKPNTGYAEIEQLRKTYFDISFSFSTPGEIYPPKRIELKFDENFK